VTAALAALLWLCGGQHMTASYYGHEFDGRPTASGMVYDCMGMTAAHRTLPFGTQILVCHGNRAVLVEISDRGPWEVDSTGAVVWPLRAHETRDLDLSLQAAKRLNMVPEGVGECTVWRVQ
jgi:rare lipoprotein A